MSTYYAGLLADIGILTLGALSVYVILATNQLSLGNAGFMAIGSYLSSYLTVELRWPLTGAVVAAALSASIIGIVVGFPALRLKGIYLAIATLGFGEMVRSFFLVFAPMGGSGGYHGMRACCARLHLDMDCRHSAHDPFARALASMAADAGRA